MANEVIVNRTPDYVLSTEKKRKLIAVDKVLPVALLITQVIQIGSFVDREATAIAVSGATVVKVDSAGTESAISAGQSLSGYWIGYKSAGGDALGASITATLEYWDGI